MAACRTVLPFSTVTGWPSMVSVTESIDLRSYRLGIGRQRPAVDSRREPGRFVAILTSRTCSVATPAVPPASRSRVPGDRHCSGAEAVARVAARSRSPHDGGRHAGYARACPSRLRPRMADRRRLSARDARRRPLIVRELRTAPPRRRPRRDRRSPAFRPACRRARSRCPCCCCSTARKCGSATERGPRRPARWAGGGGRSQLADRGALGERLTRFYEHNGTIRRWSSSRSSATARSGSRDLSAVGRASASAGSVLCTWHVQLPSSVTGRQPVAR